MKQIILTAIAIVVLGGIFALVNEAAKKQETKECLQWQAQAKEYPGFYLTNWQAEQCKARNINF